MRTYDFVTVDVFSPQRFGGNPLAIFPDAANMSDEEMQLLAREFNLSETAFVLPSTNPVHTARVRIFSRTTEMPFAGHPNVGAAYLLALRQCINGDRFEFEQLAGLVRGWIERDCDGAPTGAFVEAPKPLTLGPAVDVVTVAACAGLSREDIVTRSHPPQIVSMGNPFVMAQTTPQALRRAKAQISAFQDAAATNPALSARLALHLYAHVNDRLNARMFAPLTGTFEDPATGSANAALAGLLLSQGQEPCRNFTIQQGSELKRESLLRVKAWRSGDDIRAAVGGDCVVVLQGRAFL